MAHLRGLHRGARRGTEGLAPWYELVREIGVEGLKYVLSEVLSRVLEYALYTHLVWIRIGLGCPKADLILRSLSQCPHAPAPAATAQWPGVGACPVSTLVRAAHGHWVGPCPAPAPPARVAARAAREAPSPPAGGTR